MDSAASEISAAGVEQVLRDRMLRADQALADMGPVLRHLLSDTGAFLLDEETVARVRGMLFHLSGRLLDADGEGGAGVARQREFASTLSDAPAILAHAHALVIEARLVERLQADAGVDPVLPPLVQDLAAAQEAGLAELAMSVLAAQARFMQYHRRMELPPEELPAEVFESAMQMLETFLGQGSGLISRARRWPMAGRNSQSRLERLDQLVRRVDPRRSDALSIENAGLSIFLSALAAVTGEARGQVVMALADRRLTRLALLLRAAGMEHRELERQFLCLDPTGELPEGLAGLAAERAMEMLGLPGVRRSEPW